MPTVDCHVMSSYDYDLIVVGAGAAGLAAAASAASRGYKVLLVEHTDKVGGTTAVSGGMIWIPANHKMPAVGIDDSPAAARSYIEATVPNSLQDSRMRAYLGSGDAAIRHLEAATSLRLKPVKRYPDYYPDLPGATAGGRVLEPETFDARALGRDFRLLRHPLPEFMLFGGMMISREDIPQFRRMFRSPSAAWAVARLICRYGWQRLTAHRGTTLVLGNALAAQLFKSARDAGVQFALSTTVERLLVERGNVVGVVLLGKRGDAAVTATITGPVKARAVVLATGGVSHDPTLRTLFVPQEAGQRSATVNAHAARGGVRLGLEAGATLSRPSHNVDDALAFWVPVSSWTREDGTAGFFPHTVSDRAKPGLIAVDKHGKRFVNEARSYHEFVRAQLRHSSDAIPAWLICDKHFLWKYGLGRVRPFALSTRGDVACGYLKQASTLDALAALIDVPADGLRATIEHFNADASLGRDTAFGRGGDIYQRHLGDGDHAPNPCVAPIQEPPFYAVSVYPADLGMAAGLVTDEYARVLREDGQAIHGLYACGNDMHSVMNGAYPGPGITLGPALVFGVIASHHALGDAFNDDSKDTDIEVQSPMRAPADSEIGA